MAIEELLPLQIAQLQTTKAYASTSAHPVKFHEQAVKDFIASLPFTLTEDQKKAIWKMITLMQESQPARLLVQGDVGSGKTVVAAAIAHNTIVDGKRVMVMAPTAVLAQQHLASFLEYSIGWIVKIVFLSGAKKVMYTPEDGKWVEKKLTKKTVAKALAEAHLIIGTQALVQESVAVSNVGLVIVDEQHRFGVAQRSVFQSQATDGSMAHLLSLTATPIPRTYALMVYGDLQVAKILTKPKGRKPILTKLMTQKNRDKAYKFVQKQLDAGHQAFVVCPLVEDSDVLGVASATAMHAELSAGELKNYNVGLLHGKLKPKEKQLIMDQFASGELDVLVSTAVIEVGVDVPNATVMVIEDAQRFGLAQLHQFRGRVGRSSKQSYCVVGAEQAGKTAQERLEYFVQTTDGFALAEYDLKQRGPGEVFGKAQSGFLNFKYATLTNTEHMDVAQQIAQHVFAAGITLHTIPNFPVHTIASAHLE